ncbi:phosphoethanolamine transferase domain-containing protein [Helicobacter pullorum]|uniref:phosphoethanolamine transferase domain-containing protein n=2 Tax=Helicobacter pullorum TaxID=35818 RepID=UPI000CF154A6|nr:phosphoethanolamine transferase domain-containing protein [Helicobacter pullorum]
MSVSWFAFTLLSAIVITMLNYRAFEYVYNNLSSSNFLATLLLVVAYFCLVYIIFALLFVKYLTKFFYDYFYGVLIDSDMIKNAIETDSKEVLELLNWRLIAVFLLTIVFGWLIAKINIVYAPLKRQILFRTSSIAVALVLFVACFLPFTKTYVPFFRTHNQIRLYNTPFYQFYALLRYYQKNLIAKQEFKVLTKEVKIEDANKRLLVMVVGETARAENYSLGGYSKNDTNFFTKQESVIYFSQVSSCGTATAISLPCMFSFSKRSEYSSSEYQQNVLDVLSEGGGGAYRAL